MAREWQKEVFAFTEGFQVLYGDLDADGKNEIIIANNDATSNGMAVLHWTIWILPELTVQGAVEPVEFSVEDYGPEGTFVRQQDGTYRILVSKWKELNDAKRGSGLYLTGSWYRYAKGALLPEGGPMLARRYLFSFERERNKTFDDPQKPYLWLKSQAEQRGQPLKVE